MGLTLTVDGDRWRAHLRAAAADNPGLVPVAKGNGYGFGLGRLARKADWLGCDTLAVGTYEELPEVAQRFSGDLLVLTPWRPFGAALEVPDDLRGRVVHTVSRVEDLAGLRERTPDARFVLELLTSMRRHGLTARELRTAAADLGAGRFASLRRRRPAPAARRRLAPGGGTPAGRRGRRRRARPGAAGGRPPSHGLGLAPHRRRARAAAHHPRRLRRPPARRHRPVARRPRGAAGHRDRARRARRRARRRSSATAAAASPSPGTSSW